MELQGSRASGNCSDCAKQNLALRTGSFLEYRMTVLFRGERGALSSVGATGGYRKFRSDSAQFGPMMFLQAIVQISALR